MLVIAFALSAGLGACGFAHELPGPGAADVPDAAVDAPTDAAPRVWTVAETLEVDTASATAVSSQMVLEAGVMYRLRVSGVITNVIDNHQGDADYYDFSNPKDLGCCEDIGLGIDDLVVNDKTTQPDWGPYDPSHVYEVEWPGQGTPIQALFQDTFYGNNVGTLTLQILDLR